MVEHLYLHIPYCHRICPYCSFYKHLPGQADQGDLVSAILAEAADASERHAIAPRTLYLGGGTPSLLKAEHLARLITGLDEIFDTAGMVERSLEANPRTFDLAKARTMREVGVHRVSLGVQSWDREILRTLGRDHSPDEAVQAYELLREAEIPAVNIDLMFSIPGQSLASWEATLTTTRQLAPDHISAYNLTYEEDTEFFERLSAGEFAHDESTDSDHFATAIDFLTEAGFEHYEISNYAVPGRRSEHNQAYWAGRDYLGLGPGAVSTIHGNRSTNLKDTASYTARWLAGDDPPPRELEQIDDDARLLEHIALGLRHTDGIAHDLLPDSQLKDLIDAGFIVLGDTTARLTRRGKMLADPVIAHLIGGLD